MEPRDEATTVMVPYKLSVRAYNCSVVVSFSCQSYEGGFSAVPGSESHGGYAFCGFASALLLNKEHLCDIQKLLV